MRDRLPMLDRLRGESDAPALLATLPGIGHPYAGRLHDELGLPTLEGCEAAAHDGRLATIAALARSVSPAAGTQWRIVRVACV